MMENKIKNYFEENKNAIISCVQSLVKQKSVKTESKDNMPFGEDIAKIIDKAQNILKNYGFETKNYDNYMLECDLFDENQDVPNESDIKLGILCHLDTVPEGNGWSVNPFGGEIIDNKIFGRGTIDNKGPAVTAIFALKAIKDMNIKLKNGVRLILGTDEESGMTDLDYYMAKKKMPPFVISPDGNYPVLNIEKGIVKANIGVHYHLNKNNSRIISINGGKATNAVPDFATARIKNIDEFVLKRAISKFGTINNFISNVVFEHEDLGDETIIKAIGKGVHASYANQGNNAITALITLLTKLPFDEDESFSLLKKLSYLVPHDETNGESLGLKCSDEKSGELTLAFSVFNFGEFGFEGTFDIRFPISKTKKEIENVLKEKLTENNFELIKFAGVEPHYTPEDSKIVKSLLKVYEETTGKNGKCIAIGGGTYCHNIINGVAFGPVFEDEDDRIHGADEYINIDNLLLSCELITKAIIEICG